MFKSIDSTDRYVVICSAVKQFCFEQNIVNYATSKLLSDLYMNMLTISPLLGYFSYRAFCRKKKSIYGSIVVT